MSAVLEDLPRIDPALIDAAPQTAVAVAAQAALDLSKIDIHAVVRAQFGAMRAEAEATAKDLATVIVDVSTQAKINEAKSLRERRINAPIADARKLGKGQRSALSQAGKTSSAEEDGVVAILTKASEPLTLQIDAGQKVIDDAKEAARVAEAKRVAAHEAGIATIRSYLDRARMPGMTAARIALGIEALRLIEPGPEFQEFCGEALAAHAETLDAMRTLHDAAVVREAEAARIEAQRVENERVAAELAQQRRDIQQQRIAAAFERAVGRVGMGTAICIRDAYLLHDPEQRIVPEAYIDEYIEALDSLNVIEIIAQADTPEQDSQHVLKAEAETPDATDREIPANASPVGGPMGAGQPAAAGPSEAEAAPGMGTASLQDQVDRAVYDIMVGNIDRPALLEAWRADRAFDHGASETYFVGTGSCTSPIGVADPPRVTQLGPEEDDEGGIDALRDAALDVVVLLRLAQASRFPANPKMGTAWWSSVYAAIDALAAAGGEGA